MGAAMLRELAIRNLAVVEEARVVFGPGLNVLTGQTGAGKSIVIDALLLVRGARAQPDLIRTGAESASVEAIFEVPSTGPLAAALDDAGHGAPDGQLIVKRELSRTGRHRVFVNDSAATVGLLERLGDLLVEIHGQHEHQRLMEPARQLAVLDRFGECEEAREALARLWARWETGRAALVRFRDEAREGARKEELYRWELSEIDAVQLREGEEEELRTERRRLQNSERIYAGLQEVMALLNEDAQAACCATCHGSTPMPARPSRRWMAPTPMSRTRWRASVDSASAPSWIRIGCGRSMSASTPSWASSASTAKRRPQWLRIARRSPPRSTGSSATTPSPRRWSGRWRRVTRQPRRLPARSQRRGRKRRRSWSD